VITGYLTRVVIAGYNFFKKNISYVDYFNIFFKYKIIQNIN
jgi:hypothetical protein